MLDTAKIVAAIKSSGVARKRGVPTYYKILRLEDGNVVMRTKGAPITEQPLLVTLPEFTRDWLINPEDKSDVIKPYEDGAERRAKRRIVAAAIQYEQDGEVITIASVRHMDALTRPLLKNKPRTILVTQGFVNAYGDFLTREEAYVAARYNSQCVFKPDGVLYSEDLY